MTMKWRKRISESNQPRISYVQKDYFAFYEFVEIIDRENECVVFDLIDIHVEYKFVFQIVPMLLYQEDAAHVLACSTLWHKREYIKVIEVT
jgi:hypothetical protein